MRSRKAGFISRSQQQKQVFHVHKRTFFISYAFFFCSLKTSNRQRFVINLSKAMLSILKKFESVAP